MTAQKKFKNYSKPPITEAVIEARFVDRLSDEQLDKLVAKQKNKFHIQKIEEFGLKISNDAKAGTNAETTRSLVGYKLFDREDSSNIVQIKHQAISISRLPPYEGWGTLLVTFKKYFDLYTSNKFKALSRIGVRYINRIDIPSPDDRIELENYFKIYPHFPSNFPDIHKFIVNTVLPVDDERVLNITVQSAADSPLIDHLSIVFDLDVTQSVNLPTSQLRLNELLDTIRSLKDSLFENLLTAKCKKLFK